MAWGVASALLARRRRLLRSSPPALLNPDAAAPTWAAPGTEMKVLGHKIELLTGTAGPRRPPPSELERERGAVAEGRVRAGGGDAMPADSQPVSGWFLGGARPRPARLSESRASRWGERVRPERGVGERPSGVFEQTSSGQVPEGGKGAESPCPPIRVAWSPKKGAPDRPPAPASYSSPRDSVSAPPRRSFLLTVQAKWPGRWEARSDPDNWGPQPWVSSEKWPDTRLETTSRAWLKEINRGHWICPEEEQGQGTGVRRVRHTLQARRANAQAAPVGGVLQSPLAGARKGT